jgi:hypothetical protein
MRIGKLDALLFGLASSLCLIPVLKIEFTVNASWTGRVGIADNLLYMRHDDFPSFTGC